jgi:hypothetical protein
VGQLRVEGGKLGVFVSATILVAAVAGCRHWLERDMARHMLIEFPLLLLVGAALAWATEGATRGVLARCNLYGLAGFAFVTLTLAYWMIPAALDASVREGWIGGAKWLTLLTSGYVLPASFSLATLPVQGLMIGNIAWMSAVVGLLYQQADRQLCLYYLADAQVVAGQGLVAAAVILGLSWCLSAVHRANQRSRMESSTSSPNGVER